MERRDDASPCPAAAADADARGPTAPGVPAPAATGATDAATVDGLGSGGGSTCATGDSDGDTAASGYSSAGASTDTGVCDGDDGTVGHPDPATADAVADMRARLEAWRLEEAAELAAEAAQAGGGATEGKAYTGAAEAAASGPTATRLRVFYPELVTPGQSWVVISHLAPFDNHEDGRRAREQAIAFWVAVESPEAAKAHIARLRTEPTLARLDFFTMPSCALQLAPTRYNTRPDRRDATVKELRGVLAEDCAQAEAVDARAAVMQSWAESVDPEKWPTAEALLLPPSADVMAGPAAAAGGAGWPRDDGECGAGAGAGERRRAAAWEAGGGSVEVD